MPSRYSCAWELDKLFCKVRLCWSSQSGFLTDRQCWQCSLQKGIQGLEDIFALWRYTNEIYFCLKFMFIILNCMCMWYIQVNIGSCEGKLIHLDLELLVIVRCGAVSGKQTQVLCKSHKWSYGQARHLSCWHKEFKCMTFFITERAGLSLVLLKETPMEPPPQKRQEIHCLIPNTWAVPHKSLSKINVHNFYWKGLKISLQMQ